MFRLTKDQNVEKKMFSEQLLTLKTSKNYLLLDLLFLVASIMCMIFVSIWFFSMIILLIYFLKNHIFDYRFNRAIALMLQQSSSFNVTNEEKQFIKYF